MPSSRRNQLAVVALALLCAVLGWRASQRLANRPSPAAARNSAPAAASSLQHPLLAATPTAVPVARKWVTVTELEPNAAPRFADAQVTNRLRNTPAPINELIRNERALLLRNALVDTASGEPLPVPAALRAQGEAGAYLVQAAGVISPKFRERLQAAGLEIVSYIPNNALLVRGSKAAVEQAAAGEEVAALVPYEPVFKLEPELLGRALAGEALPAGAKLVLTVPDPAATMPAVATLGARETFRERGPFGPLVTVEAPADSLVALAQLPGVQLVEKWVPRALANDRAGYLLSSTTNVENTLPYLGLTGDGVLVNINDSGVDAGHPDLSNRVFTVTGGDGILRDPDGHGTHVAATIAGDGTVSANIGGTPSGSVSNASFQGRATKAKLFVLPVDLLQGPLSGDSYLQEEAARAPQRSSRTNPLISNNSWGYLTREYSSHSASYDAAVRDALPGESGSQPILYVFSAGNEGFGGNGGNGGVPDSIVSPGNAKNVITVGALESARNLTNAIVYDTNGVAVKIGSREFPDRGYSPTNETYFTNEVLVEFTDTDYQVAGYSSRGNVGIGIEGSVGRFKPDVVAPGSFILSARSSEWRLENQLDPTSDSYYLFEEIERTNAPYYRYESGTSMAAPAISGLLAQMQEYFEKSGQFLPAAGFKALLLNSALATSPLYTPNFGEFYNYAGWGRPDLRRVLRGGFQEDSTSAPLIGFPGELATGEAIQFRIRPTKTNSPLRLTLVWTDPPGNPVSSTKLVNDLDLVVSNTVTGEIFYGNDLDPGSGYSRAANTNSTVPLGDRINNVERIIINSPLAQEYVITVVGYRVNVNSRTDHPDNVVQDFALAFATDDDSEDVAGRIIFPAQAKVEAITLGFESPTPPQRITNGVALLGQVAGANSPLINRPLGVTNQWRFYLFTNLPGGTSPDGYLTNGSNVAFVIFPVDPQGNLSRARTNGPDLDLYVSTDPGLTNLDVNVIDEAWKSRSAGGIEMVALSNQPVSVDQVYYVGVKSEDQQSGQYGFVGISTDRPFTAGGSFGGQRPLAVPITQPIPDGTPDRPGVGIWMAISLLPQELRRVYAEVATSHENFSDLLGEVQFRQGTATLNNHGPLLGIYGGTNVNVLYDDSGSLDPASLPNLRPSDGPGSLNAFLGVSGAGPWFLATVDNASGYTGRVNSFNLEVLPNDFGDAFVNRCVRGRGVELEIINVPPDASRMIITVTNQASPADPMAGPVEVYIRREEFPDIDTPENNDKWATIQPPGGNITLGIRDVPPLRAGRYFIAVYNPNAYQVCYRIRALIERNLDASFTRTFVSDASNNIVLPDEARAFSRISIDDSRPITAMEVGLRVNHPRVSDLDIRLLNPSGARTVLFENRGGLTAGGLGSEVITTNQAWQHVALAFEDLSDTATIYLDGKTVAQGRFPGYVPVTSNELYFARDPSGVVVRSRAPIGLDDFAIWRRALRPAEAQQIYLDGMAGVGKQPGSARNGMTALWNFDRNIDNQITGVRLSLVGALERDIYGPGQIGFGFYGNDRAPSAPHLRVALEDPLRQRPFITGYTFDGWIKYTNGAGPSVVFSYGAETAVHPLGPSLFVGLSSPLGNGPNSLTAILGYTPDGTPITLKSPAGVLSPGRTVTNTIYASFSDDTNRAFQPIKFVEPPFSGQAAANQLILQEGFESVAPGTYVLDDIVEGWRVTANEVDVLRGVAHLDSQSLALRQGSIRRAFGVAVGQAYRLSFVSRKHPADTNPVSPVKLLVNGVTNRTIAVPATAGWTNNEILIRPVFSSVVIDLVAGTNGVNSPGMLIDTVKLEQLGGNLAYIPEEPLKGAFGSNGAGQWQLEVTDARGTQVGNILEWAINLTFAPTNPPAYRLTNGVTFITNAVGNEPTYFIVEVPPEVFVTTNTLASLTGGPLNLLFSQTGLPDGLQADDYTLLSGVGTTPQFSLLRTNLLPSFVPGQRYYLGVKNATAGQTYQFAIRVDFGLNIVPLTNNVPLVATNSNRGLIDYYSFDVSTNALGVRFALTNLGGDVNLIARRAPNLPTRTVYDYTSTNSGTLPEEIQIDPFSQPVALTPGRWYLGVYPNDPNTPPQPLPYTILASELVGSIRPLTNTIPVASSILTNGTVDYYYIDVTNDVLSLAFALTNLSGNADIFVRKGVPLPTPASFDLASTNLDTTDELIFITPSTSSLLFTPGRWFVAVVPQEDAPIFYSLVANFVPATSGFEFLQDSIPVTKLMPGGPTSQLYRFDVSLDSTSAILFEIYGLDGEADLFVSKDAPPSASPVVYSAIRAGTQSETLVVNTADVAQLGGEWYLEIRFPTSVPVNYTVRAATKQGGLLLTGQTIKPSLVVPTTGNPTITWNAVPGESYEVQYSDDLSNSPVVWLPIPPVIKATTDTATAVLPPFDTATFPLRFYRLIQVATFP